MLLDTLVVREVTVNHSHSGIPYTGSNPVPAALSFQTI